MNLKQLETFLQIVEKGSFAAAAEVLHTTQSTVSARVKDLEHHLGVQLFDRSTHRAQLTAPGRELFEMSQQLMALMDSLRERIGSGGALSGSLRLGVVGLVAGTWLPALVARIQERHPRLALQLEVALSRVLLERLKDGHLDLAIVAGLVDDESLHAETIGQAEFAWMASPSLQLPRRLLAPSDLRQWPILSFPQESYHVPVIKRWFRDAGVAFKPAVTCNSMDVIASLVMQGRGIALLPREHFQPELAAGRLEILSTAPALPGVELALARPAQRQTALSSAASECIREVARAPRSQVAAAPSALTRR